MDVNSTKTSTVHSILPKANSCKFISLVDDGIFSDDKLNYIENIYGYVNNAFIDDEYN